MLFITLYAKTESIAQVQHLDECVKTTWEYLSIKSGDIITGVKQAVKPNWLKGTFEGKEDLV